ncbi:SURF1 family protein [Hoeflea prorocentri]|uniref:SURF1-like protein n=1 Tax=Hoeflea prorocentri TaxID=1922333 RepID=A0A9X3ZI57_9HYPH|nr:SURF1 family protein [Hoeflea prorocentri]MCY6381658.1 SURF1 family protein [Hoeflea prorocentri]MDA5399458.1 SURF1 family protein [Hoeflea prorocentri]
MAEQSRQPGMSRRSLVLLLAFVLPALAFLLMLGNWQVNRLQWKESLIATIENRMNEAPAPVDDIISEWRASGDVAYMPVRFEGVFDHAAEQHYLATHEGQSGWYLYTPVELADGRVLIVNRGFVPYDFKDPSNRPWTAPDGMVELIGVARNPLAQKPGSLVPDNEPQNSTWYWKDHSAMAANMDLDEAALIPFFVDVSGGSGAVTPGPVPGVTRVSLPNNHLQYAVTWFGLAAALAVVAGYFIWRSRRTP